MNVQSRSRMLKNWPDYRSAKAPFHLLSGAEVRRHGEQTGFETLVVHAVNDAY